MNAFPSTQYLTGISPSGHSTGMTLRDYFAAKAMQGFAADPEIDAGSLEIAETAYKWADAMLKARAAE